MTTRTITPFSAPDLDLQAVHEAFWRDGLVVVHDLFSTEQMTTATTALLALLERLDSQTWGGGEIYGRTFETWTKAFFKLQDEAFLSLFAHPELAALTETIVGPGHTVNPIGAWATGPGHGQAWHQDSGSRDPALYNLNRIIFTRDVLPGQGDLLVVPGSHRDRDLPAGDLYEPIDGQVAICPRANTLVLLHTRCFHCVTRNQTDEVRIQVNRRVCPAGVDPNICSQARFRTGTWDFSTGAPWA